MMDKSPGNGRPEQHRHQAPGSASRAIVRGLFKSWRKLRKSPGPGRNTLRSLLLLGLTWAQALQAGENGRFLLWLDGYNAIPYDQEYPARSGDFLSSIQGNPLDSAHFIPAPASGTFGSARIGAETGDGLFNQFTIGAQPNRDHASDVLGAFHFERIPLSFFARYRYFDAYSDRFDSLWSLYAAATSRPMAFQEEGLVQDYTGTYAYSGHRVDAAGSFSKYLGWGAAPVEFTPLFRDGALIRQQLVVRLPLARIQADASMDFQDTYFDHHIPDQRIRSKVSIAWIQDIVRDIYLTLGGETRSGFSPATRAQVTFADSTIDPLAWRASAYVYEDGRIMGGLEGGYSVIGPVWVKAAAGYDLEPQDEDYRFVAITDTFRYYHLASEALSLHVSAGQNDTSAFPLTGAIWYDLAQRVRIELIDTSEGRRDIMQGALDQPLSTAGARVCYSYDLYPFGTRVWINGHAVLNDATENLSLPWNCGMDFSYGDEKHLRRPFGTISLEALGPVTLTRRYRGGGIERLSVQNQAFLSLRLGVPFSVPFTGGRLATRFVATAGPIRFIGDTRMRMHPGGNLIGPMIAAKVEGWIR